MIEEQTTAQHREMVWQYLRKNMSEADLLNFVTKVKQWKTKAYAPAFPQHCSGCGVQVSDYESYLKFPLLKEESEKGGFMSIRACSCGQPVTVIIACRRDLSENGLERREMFDSWVKAVVRDIGIPSWQAQVIIRSFFAEELLPSDL